MTTSIYMDKPTGWIPSDDSTDNHTRTISDLVGDTGYLRTQTRVLVQASHQMNQSTESLHIEALVQMHLTLANDRAKEPLAELLEILSDLGFSWRDIARLSGVSVPALRKWRHGGTPTGSNRKRVAMVVAFCDIAWEQYLIDDVAGWLETPLHPDAPISGLDLIEKERFDLALRAASDRMDNPESILNEFEPNWQENYQSRVEIFTAPDGLLGLRLAGEAN